MVSHPVPEIPLSGAVKQPPSVKSLIPNLINIARLKVNPSFSRFMKRLEQRTVTISNPGAIIIAPFLDQLGVVEALRTYGPESFKSLEITNLRV